MTTGLVLDRCFLNHRVHVGHPERAERIDAIESALKKAGLVKQCVLIPPERAELSAIELNHEPDYITRVEYACRGGDRTIDCADSAISPDSFDTALLATGSVIAATRAVMSGSVANAFCVVRPPGHHAEYDESMGFCLFNSIAIAARYLMAEHGLERILIFDWDVHHGNGTQHAFEEDPRVLFVSMHGHPATLYPHMGFEDETGRGAGAGFTLNIPMRPGSGDPEYRTAFEQRALPRIEEFAPQFVLISAGFDAHKLDPVGNQALESTSFRWLTREMLAVAEKYAGGHLVSILEGGYSLEALSESVTIHLETLLEGV